MLVASRISDAIGRRAPVVLVALAAAAAGWILAGLTVGPWSQLAGCGIVASQLVGSFGVGPMAGIMVCGMLMAFLASWLIERQAAAATLCT